MTAPVPHDSFTFPVSHARQRRRLRKRRRLFAQHLLVLLAAVGLAVSSQRVIMAPGLELYLGPLFYLFAFWLFGVRAGVAVAVITMAPTYFWWGHPFSVVLGVGHVLFLHWIGQRQANYSIATLVYGATFAAAAGYALIIWNYEVPPALATLLVLRKILNDVLFAAIVDCVRLLLQVDKRRIALVRRRCVWLPAAVTTSTMFFAVTGCMALFVVEVGNFSMRFDAAIRDVDTEVLRITDLEHAAVHSVRGTHEVQTFMGPVQVLMAPSRALLGDTARIGRELGCSTFDDGRQVTGPNDRGTFAYWVNACRVGELGGTGHELAYAASIRPLVLKAYQTLLTELLAVIALAALGIISCQWLRRLTHNTMISWFEVVRDFGTPGLVAPPPVPLKDFQPAIDAFVHENNAYVALAREREQLALAVGELKNAIDLTLIADIYFDQAAGELVFDRLDNTSRENHRLLIHEGDRQELVTAAGKSEVMVEFRPADGAATEWYMLIARNPDLQSRWKAGCMLRLRQSKMQQDRMLHQGRLMDLGGMASALSHEIKQPLFTIALAAENALFQVEASGDESLTPIIKKLGRIGDQVDRARSIIDQVSHYARLETPEGELFDPMEAVTASASFVRPMLVADEMTLSIAHDHDQSLRVSMARVGLEQIVVNALQNAHDSILTRRQGGDPTPGRITIGLRKVEELVEITIADNGTGLSGEASSKAFEAFFTTKGPHRGTGLGLYICRQIMIEAGGRMDLSNGSEGGAVLTITVPCRTAIASAIGHFA
ncbi:sensor histidine kinase [Sphingomonas glaciei]|uniref:histidine kinase n=1 Tax=Sphingomonas glaciei TaxID=2938948 RepID=A0ABY5MVT3_9SPHN|nr:ATP-binding protein [Sphingomonas glaciei]UUR08363.1 ATP-binding protein [Sphingomonas glaciei]